MATSEAGTSVAEHKTQLDIDHLGNLSSENEMGLHFPALHLVRSSYVVRNMARWTFFMLFLAAIALVFTPWLQTSKGTGRVVARDPQKRPQVVTATYDGIIDWVKEGLQEGSRVEEGERLMRIDPFAAEQIERVRSQLFQLQSKQSLIEANRDLARQNIQNVTAAGSATIAQLQSDILAIDARLKQLDEEILGLEADQVARQFQFVGDKELLPQGLRSELEVERSRAALRLISQQIEAQKNRRVDIEKQKEAKESELESRREMIAASINDSQIRVKIEETKLAETLKEIEDVEIKLNELQRLDVYAPRSGIIQALQIAAKSDTVKKGDPLFMVVPETDDLAVELTIRGMDVPLVRIGDEVRLQFQGWPAIQWVGWPSIAVGTFGGVVTSLNPGDDGRGDFIVFVTPDDGYITQDPWPDNRYLRQGMRANGWVLLRQVPLGYELWRLLNGFPPIVDDPTDKDTDIKKPKLPK